MHNLHLCTMASSFMSSRGRNRCGSEKEKLVSTATKSSPDYVSHPLLRRPFVNIHMGSKYLGCFSHSKRPIHMHICSQLPYARFSSYIPFEVPTTQPNHCLQLTNIYSHTSGHFFLQRLQPGTLLKSSARWDITYLYLLFNTEKQSLYPCSIQSDERGNSRNPKSGPKHPP